METLSIPYPASKRNLKRWTVKCHLDELGLALIAGLSFLTVDASGIVFGLLQRRSEEFRALEGLHEMATEKLLEWERWSNNLDDLLKESERIATDGEAFFAESNLK